MVKKNAVTNAVLVKVLGSIILALLMVLGVLVMRVWHLQDLMRNHTKDYHCLLAGHDKVKQIGR